MAGEKTEQPTEKKLRDARRKGQVSRSNDLTQAFLFFAAAGVLSFSAAALSGRLRGLLTEFLAGRMMSGEVEPWQAAALLGSAAARALLLTAPLLAAVFVVSAAVSYPQVGSLFSPEVLKPKLEKLNPAEGFKNIFFKSRTYLELIKNLLKFAIVAWVVYATLKAYLPDILMSVLADLQETGAFAARLMFGLLFKIGAVFLVIGAADWMIQKKLHIKSLMMSKQEVKQEFKESEGDPHVKHARKHLHEELLAHNMATNVPKATVVLVNPTHLAVALEYNESTMAAPCVTARGASAIAARIRDLAQQHNVPVVRNVELARALFEIELGREIPEHLYEAVAEVLNWVHQLTAQHQSGGT